MKPCVVCGNQMETKQSNKLVCGDTCKKRLSRAISKSKGCNIAGMPFAIQMKIDSGIKLSAKEQLDAAAVLKEQGVLSYHIKENA